MVDTSRGTAPKTSMIFKIQALTAHLYQLLLITIVFSFAKPWDAAANVPFNIDNVTSLARQLAAEPLRPPPPVPDFLKQLSYDDYRDIVSTPSSRYGKNPVVISRFNSSTPASTILTGSLSIPMTRREFARLLSPLNSLPTAETNLPTRCPPI